MPVDLGLDDRSLLDLASQPRTTRQRSSAPSNQNSTTMAAALASTDDIAEMRLDDDDYAIGGEESDEDDSASAYQESLSPPPPIPTSSSRGSFQAPAGSPKISRGGAPSSGGTALAGPATDSQATVQTPTAAKRGRKPAPAASRGAREQARKTNHSRIEKRRREKINEALATLRELVPSDIVTAVNTMSPGISPALSAIGAGGKKKAGEKEFKLEVLERTVVFVKYLLERVGELEHQLLSNPTSAPSREGNNDSGAPAFDPARSPSSPTVKKRRRNDSMSMPSPLVSATPAGPSRPNKRTRPTESDSMSHSTFPAESSNSNIHGAGYRSYPNDRMGEYDDDDSAPPSPATTLAYSTPYIAASATWNTGEAAPGSSTFGGSKDHKGSVSPNSGMMHEVNGVSRTSSNPSLTMTPNMGSGDRPKLPSIAAMLNSPYELSSPSMLPTQPTDELLASPAIPMLPDSYHYRQEQQHQHGSKRTPLSTPGSGSIAAGTVHSKSGMTPPLPLRLPSSSLPHTLPTNRPAHDEDETTAAATLLMHFSERTLGSGSGSGASVAVASKGDAITHGPALAHTPGSILGLGHR